MKQCYCFQIDNTTVAMHTDKVNFKMGQLGKSPQIRDVGVDANNFKPVGLNEIWVHFGIA